MLLRTHCALQYSASATWSTVFKFREYHTSPLKDSLLPKIGTPNFSAWHSEGFPMRPSSSPVCPLPVPLNYSHIPGQQSYLKLFPQLPPYCFTHHTPSSHFTLESAHSQPVEPHPSSNLERALQPLMDLQWSLVHQIVGKFTPVTMKPSLFMHLVAELWMVHHCHQPLVSIFLSKPLLTTILYQVSLCD